MATLRLLLEDDDGSLVDETTIQLSEKQLLTILKGQLGTYLIEECLPSGDLGRVQLLLQIHDAILVQYPESIEPEIIPLLLSTIQHPIQLKHNRTLIIPSEAQIGWNWGKYDERENPDGLRTWKPPSPTPAGAPAPRKLTSWIESFVKYTEVFNSPEVFRRWAAIGIVAGALEQKVWVRTKGSDLFPNQYIILVGPPGIGKSAILSVAEKFLTSRS
jgi:hypothetical protein